MVSILNAVRDLGRIHQIYAVLVRHGFGELAERLGFGAKRAAKLPAVGSEAITVEELSLEAPSEAEQARGEEAKKKRSLGERVRLVAMDLGPSFVKLGQIASTRPDVVPADWIVELKKLQDEVTPLSFEEIRGALESSLGASIEDLFESFDDKPLAAASIGQVHRAVLKHPEGPKDVVVKVQRPGVRATVARDLELLYALAKLIERTIPESRIYSPSGLVEQFDYAITSELDFSLEADNAQRFQANFAGHPHARFPIIYKEASTKRVLTLEFLRGHKIYDAIQNHGHKGPVIAKASMGVVLKMIFEDGFFHADPHPGNILLWGEPDHPLIGLIDLGMVGRLSPEMRDKTIDLMVGAVRQDYIAMAEALYAIGTPTKKIDMRAYRAEVAMLAEKYLGRPLKEIDLSAMISDLVRGATKYGLEIPPDFLLVGKALMTMEGVGKEIDPDLDVLGEARPFFLGLLRRRYSPERVGNELWRGVERLSTTAYDLPQQLREVLEDLRLGRLTLRTTDETALKSIDRLGRRLRAGFFVTAFVISGTWLLATNAHEPIGIGLLGFGALLMLAHTVRDAFR